MEQRSDPVIFINYRRSDAGWPADRLAERLRTAFGNDRVFLDVRSIEAGEDFTEEIKSRLERAAVLLVLIGKRWLFVQDEHGRRRLDNRNDWVRQEIRTVLGRKNSKVIPVLLDDAELPREKKALPGDISSLLTRQRVSIRQAESERDIDQLIYEIEKSGFERLADSTSQGAGTPRPVPREAVGIRLLTSRKAAERSLKDLIERGEALLLELRKLPPASSQEQLDEKARRWHHWRVQSEQSLRGLFSSEEPLLWLKNELRPRHLNYREPLVQRDKHLLRDIESETLYLRTLLGRLDNYGEASADRG